MSTHAEGKLVVSDWNEAPLAQIEGGAALARATSESVFTGELEGKGAAGWLLAYPPDGVPSFVGTQAFAGTLAGRAGTFVLQMTGTFADNAINVTWSVMPGSATGDLSGLRGEGGYVSAPEAAAATAELDFELG